MSASFSLSRALNRMVAGSSSITTAPRSPQLQKSNLASSSLPLIAICHLSWDWVWQRPQQFISRLAQTHPVLFVETHVSDAAEGFTRSRPAPNHPQVTILEMHLPRRHWADGGFIDVERRRILLDRLSHEFAGRYDGCILWMNDPMAVTAFAGNLGERLLVYDCMDELSQFRGAPPALVQRELELTRRADVIFCGGQKMREKRLPLNSNTHFYGTGVDCDHFGSVLAEHLTIDADIARLRGPVLGYIGVIDERIDYDLIAALADASSEWNIAMVGPIAKIDPASLPRRPNLHWLGGREYLRLPSILKGFSVALMPFARNRATEYINPTKALEYMAAGRPIVSTALDEVKKNFNSVSHIAEDQAEFIALCREQTTTPSQVRIRRGLKLASDNTWEAIAAKMEAHLCDALFSSHEPAEVFASEKVAASPPQDLFSSRPFATG